MSWDVKQPTNQQTISVCVDLSTVTQVSQCWLGGPWQAPGQSINHHLPASLYLQPSVARQVLSVNSLELPPVRGGGRGGGGCQQAALDERGCRPVSTPMTSHNALLNESKSAALRPAAQATSKDPGGSIAIVGLRALAHWAKSLRRVCVLVGCLTSQQQASVSQGRICEDHFYALPH